MTAHTQSADQLMEKIQSLPSERITEVEDFVDFLKSRTKRRKPSFAYKETLNFPVISIGEWPEDLSLRREDMYDDDGR
jgi:hypothetical protein